MTVQDIDSIFAQAEVLDADEVAELGTARKVTALPARLVQGFDERDEDTLFVPASALGNRRTRDGKQVPYDTKALQILAGNARGWAIDNGYTVDTQARRRDGVEGLLFTREQPVKREGVGRPKAEPAE